MSTSKRKEAVERFLSQFIVGDVWSTRLYVEITDTHMRIVWTSNGPDDVDCGVAVFDSEGNWEFKGVSHIWNDEHIRNMPMDNKLEEGALTKLPQLTDSKGFKRIKRFIGVC